jgi:predicted nucleic acid-binding protein
MSRRKYILDTSLLIAHWHRCRSRAGKDVKPQQAVAWAEELIELWESNAIVTPIHVEMVAGVKSQAELHLTQAYLSRFECVDEGRILPQDWKLAIDLAQRVPRDRKPRQLGDCLIRAIARRLHYEVKTLDQGFPRVG